MLQKKEKKDRTRDLQFQMSVKGKKRYITEEDLKQGPLAPLYKCSFVRSFVVQLTTLNGARSNNVHQSHMNIIMWFI